jgi:hypothetical protein
MRRASLGQQAAVADAVKAARHMHQETAHVLISCEGYALVSLAAFNWATKLQKSWFHLPIPMGVPDQYFERRRLRPMKGCDRTCGLASTLFHRGDIDCIGGLRCDARCQPAPHKRSLIHRFDFPAEDYKLGVGDRPLIAETLRPVGEIVELDAEQFTVSPSRTCV